jgi:hypothetical protein
VRVLEKYTGDDPNAHHWKLSIGPRGVHIFEVLPPPESEPDIEEL